MSTLSTALWKEPQQTRSRARVDKILHVAQQLISRKGLDGFTMQEIAEQAEVSIGSLYQFFPDRNALVAKMFSDLLEEIDAHIQKKLTGVETIADLKIATASLVEGLYGIAKQKPAYVQIWHSLQALPAIRHMDEENSQKNGKLLAAIIRRFAPSAVSDQRIQTACLLISSLLTAVMQLSLTMPAREAITIINEYDKMAGIYIQSLLSERADFTNGIGATRKIDTLKK